MPNPFESDEADAHMKKVGREQLLSRCREIQEQMGDAGDGLSFAIENDKLVVSGPQDAQRKFEERLRASGG